MTSLQKCKPRDQTTRKIICPIFKSNIAHLAHRRSLRTLIIAPAERLKSLFVQAKFTLTLWIGKIHVPNENNSAIFIPTIRGECAAYRNCSKNVTSVSNIKSILVTQVDNFCKNELITKKFKLSDGKDSRFVLFKPER